MRQMSPHPSHGPAHAPLHLHRETPHRSSGRSLPNAVSPRCRLNPSPQRLPHPCSIHIVSPLFSNVLSPKSQDGLDSSHLVPCTVGRSQSGGQVHGTTSTGLAVAFMLPQDNPHRSASPRLPSLSEDHTWPELGPPPSAAHSPGLAVTCPQPGMLGQTGCMMAAGAADQGPLQVPSGPSHTAPGLCTTWAQTETLE